MNKMLTLAVFGVAAVAVAMAVTLAAPPAKAWDTSDVCFLWYSTVNNEASWNLPQFPTHVVWAADAGDIGCMDAVYECWYHGLYMISYDQSYMTNC